MTPTELRERIEAALRVRDPEAHVTLGHVGPADAVLTAHASTRIDALAALAVAVGLHADGTDPRAELETLRAAAREYIDAVADIERAVTGPRTGVVIDSAAMIARRNAARVALAAIVGGKS